MNETRRKYKVLKPVGWSGRREIGELLDLTDAEAANLGGEYVALESEAATAVDGAQAPKVEDEGAVKPKGSRKAKPKPKK